MDRKLEEELPLRQEIAGLKADLTFAAELLATASSTQKAANGGTAVDMLLRLSRSDWSVIREGAIYVLTGHRDSPGVETRLLELAKDKSPGVATAVGDLRT